MVKAHIYLEGGGGRDLHARCREGFNKLLKKCGFEWRMPKLTASGDRDSVYEDFKPAHADASRQTYIAMLVDSEDPVQVRPLPLGTSPPKARQVCPIGFSIASWGQWMSIRIVSVIIIPIAVIAAVVMLVVVLVELVPNALLAPEAVPKHARTATATANREPISAVSRTAEPKAEIPRSTMLTPPDLPVLFARAQHPIESTQRATAASVSEPEQAASVQGNVYTWEDGERTLRVVLHDNLVVQSTPANTPEPEQAASVQGNVYTWEDGERTLRVVLHDDLVVQNTPANAPDDVVMAEVAGNSIVWRQAKHGQDARPVFRLESGGGLMTLPGGVLIALDPELDQAAIESFFSRNNISTDLTSGLEYIINGFLVESEPGFPSLELANRLAAQQGVLIASPNWWRETEVE